MNRSENTIFDDSMNNSTPQVENNSQTTTLERTSTPVPIAIDSAPDQNHCSSELRTSMPASPRDERSPSWEQQTNTNSNSADNDANDSEVLVMQNLIEK